MKDKYCIRIEVEETYELFDDIEKAFNFYKENEKGICDIDLVLASNLYEENKVLNYEDFSDTILDEIKTDKQKVDVKKFTKFVLDKYKIDYDNDDIDDLMLSFGLKYEVDKDE
jgi:hypothetical protein